MLENQIVCNLVRVYLHVNGTEIAYLRIRNQVCSSTSHDIFDMTTESTIHSYTSSAIGRLSIIAVNIQMMIHAIKAQDII